ncbi:hypothetical protein EAO30_27280 [Klebsiella pneumoniae]|nr:hypothetical protein EAO30_27280 [Klebsiella pneumoniae]
MHQGRSAHADLHKVAVLAVVVHPFLQLLLVGAFDGAAVDLRALPAVLVFAEALRNRPVLRVGLPNATQIISVSSSVSAPSATSHTRSAILEASSNTTMMRLRSLWRPANASVLCSDRE